MSNGNVYSVKLGGGGTRPWQRGWGNLLKAWAIRRSYLEKRRQEEEAKARAEAEGRPADEEPTPGDGEQVPEPALLPLQRQLAALLGTGAWLPSGGAAGAMLGAGMGLGAAGLLGPGLGLLGGAHGLGVRGGTLRSLLGMMITSPERVRGMVGDAVFRTLQMLLRSVAAQGGLGGWSAGQGPGAPPSAGQPPYAP